MGAGRETRCAGAAGRFGRLGAVGRGAGRAAAEALRALVRAGFFTAAFLRLAAERAGFALGRELFLRTGFRAFGRAAARDFRAERAAGRLADARLDPGRSLRERRAGFLRAMVVASAQVAFGSLSTG